MGKDLQKKLIILFVMTLNGILFQAMVLWDFSSEALLPTMMYAYISPLFFLMMVFLLTALINIFRLNKIVLNATNVLSKIVGMFFFVVLIGLLLRFI